MPKVEVEVNSKDIEKSVQQEISKLQQKVHRLETQVKKLKQELYSNKEIVNRAKSIIFAVREAGNFPYEEDNGMY